MTSGSMTVRGADGVELVARITGSGDPIVLVHGTTGSKDSWVRIEPLLAEWFTVWAYDRRGRGESGDGDEYDLEREVADLHAVIAATGGRPHLLGHSFGGSCALEAARTADLRSLVVYEPAGRVDRRQDVIARVVALLDEGRGEEALEVQLVDGAGVSPDELAFLRSVPEVWSRLHATIPTLRREVQALLARPWDADRFRSIRCPTLLVAGELTESPVYLSHAELVEAIPRAALVVLPGQRHLAFATDPESFAAAVTSFALRTGVPE